MLKIKLLKRKQSESKYRCNICFSNYSDDAYISIVNKLFTHKTFFIYNKKAKKSKLYRSHTLVVSEKGMINNDSASIGNAVRIKFGILSSFEYGNVIQIELCCDKCYNTRFCEINLEKISGKNHWV